jgi:uroporphyrin-III C-methyltransferase
LNTRHPRRLPAPAAPWCALVGAGPGDPELLTLKAIRLIRRATVLLVDDLVSPAVVDRALAGRRRRPRIVQVGKRGGCRSTPQAFIERLMVTEALAGERVVRLKGGDPFIFGRGGEEAEVLRAHGIEVEIANGVTAAMAASAALGVALTHREHSQGVIFVTGHAKPGGTSPHWPTLAAAAAQGLTLVIYMGMAGWPHLQRSLLQALPSDTPAAVVQHASLPAQRSAVTTLGRLSDTIALGGFGSPAIVIVGDVLQGAMALATQAPHTRAA